MRIYLLFYVGFVRLHMDFLNKTCTALIRCGDFGQIIIIRDILLKKLGVCEYLNTVKHRTVLNF